MTKQLKVLLYKDTPYWDVTIEVIPLYFILRRRAKTYENRKKKVPPGYIKCDHLVITHCNGCPPPKIAF